MRDCSAVRLAWVMVDGVLAPVSAYAHLAPAERPAAACPVCGRAVTFKLGEQRVHHAAHQPGVRCPVEAGETALHLNAKCALWAALGAAAAGRPAWRRGAGAGVAGARDPLSAAVPVRPRGAAVGGDRGRWTAAGVGGVSSPA